MKNKNTGGRVPTGIKGLDEAMDGGLVRNSICLLSGNPGSGKSIFAMQYLVNGIVKYGEPGVYITLEEKKDKLIENMKNFGWDLEKLEKEGKLGIIDLSPSSDFNAKSFSDLEDGIIKKTRAKRIVMDSLTSYFLLFEENSNKREASLNLFDLLGNWGCTSMLIEECDIESKRDSYFEFQADCIILLSNIKHQDVRTRAIEIYKMRGSKHSTKTFPLEIKENGVVVYPEQEVFGGN
jgi:KaiC/GvpD/RAD55 family RecA-like ATPase